MQGELDDAYDFEAVAGRDTVGADDLPVPEVRA